MQYSLSSQGTNGNVLSTLKTKCHPFNAFRHARGLIENAPGNR